MEATNESLKQEESRSRTVAEIKEQAKREFMDEVEGEVAAWNRQLEDSDKDDDDKALDYKNRAARSGRLPRLFESLPLAFTVLVSSSR
jgi:hypothetical protein